MSSRGFAIGVGVAAGAAVLVAAVASAGLLSPRDEPARLPISRAGTAEAPTPTPSPVAPAATPTPLSADRVLATTHLDPGALPVRTIESAALVVQVYDGASSQPLLVAVDAATAEWVRLDLPGPWHPGIVSLSPDGRALLRARVEPLAPPGYDVIELATAAVRDVPMPLPPGHAAEDCWHRDAAWSPGGSRVGVVTGCLLDRPGHAWPDDVGMDTWVHEVDVLTGAVTVVEHVPDSGPVEAYPAYSPDGRFLAYGIGYGPVDGEDEGWETLRIIEVGGTLVHESHAVHMVYGDPWQDADTLLAWDEFGVAEDSHLVFDAPSGTSTPLGIERLFNAAGYVGGHLVIDTTPWVEAPIPCEVALCVVDPATGAARPWLTTSEGAGLVYSSLSPARDLIVP